VCSYIPFSTLSVSASGNMLKAKACVKLSLWLKEKYSDIHWPNLLPKMSLDNPKFKSSDIAANLDEGASSREIGWISAGSYNLIVEEVVGASAKNKSGDARLWLGLDGLLLALICLCFIVLVNGSGDDSRQRNEESPGASILSSAAATRKDSSEVRKPLWNLRILNAIPSALIVFVLGIVFAILRKPNVLRHLKLGPSKAQLIRISRHDWKTGFVRAAIPQIPLSILNSVIAVCKLSTDLFPNKEVTATSVSVSVGIMNLVGCWFGAMLICHGAGGLAGQYKFGAKSGVSVAFLGTAKLVLGLILGSQLVKILSQFPNWDVGCVAAFFWY
jgi:hypothetical protein